MRRKARSGALQFELVRQYSVAELEKKFQNDIMHNILNGKIDSISELQKNTSLLGVPINGCFRVIVFGLKGEDRDKKDFKSKISDTNLLSDAIACHVGNVKIYNDLDRVVVIKEVDKEQTQEEYREEIRGVVEDVQSYVTRYNKDMQVKAAWARWWKASSICRRASKRRQRHYLCGYCRRDLRRRQFPGDVVF